MTALFTTDSSLCVPKTCFYNLLIYSFIDCSLMPDFQPSEYDVWLLPRPIAWAEIWRPCRPQNKTNHLSFRTYRRNRAKFHGTSSEKSIETWLVLYTDSSLRSEWQGLTTYNLLFHSRYSFLIQCPQGRKLACCASCSEVKKTLLLLSNLLPEVQVRVP